MLSVLAALAWAASPEEAVRLSVASRLGLMVEDVEVTEVGLPASAPLDAEWQVGLPRSGGLTGSVPVVLEAEGGRWAVRPRVVAWASVPVAAGPTERGERVRVVMERRRLDTLRGEDPVDPAEEWIARVPFSQGDPVTRGRVRPLPDATEGEGATIVAGVGGLTVTAPGRLLEDGWVGKPVTTLNLATSAVVTGTYGLDGRVHLEEP